MAKRKVIKFVHQGHRSAKAGEYYTVGDKSEMFYAERDRTLPQYVYHKIETEEEVPRWRAELGGVYYRANAFLQIVSVTENRCILDEIAIDVLRSIEKGGISDNLLYKSGNYFQTKEQAQEYLNHCKTFFENN